MSLWKTKCLVCDVQFDECEDKTCTILCRHCQTLRKQILTNSLPDDQCIKGFRLIVKCKKIESFDDGFPDYGDDELLGDYPVYNKFCNSMIDRTGNVLLKCKLRHLYRDKSYYIFYMKIVKETRVVDLGC